MPRIVDVHQGLGSHELLLKTNDPTILDELIPGRHLLYYEGQRLIGCFVITQPPLRSRRVAGPGLEWWLGAEQVGPTIGDRTYLSGTSKLANGNFELEIPTLYWALGLDSRWVITTLQANLTAGDQLRSDVLQTQQELDVEPGQTFDVWGTAGRPTGTAGRLRLRPTLIGNFPAAERVTNGGFEDGTTGWGTPFPGPISIVTDAGETQWGSKVLRLGPNNRPNLADLTSQPNPSFELAGTDPDQVADGWVGQGAAPPASDNFVRDAAAARGGSWGVRITPPFEAASEDGTDTIIYIEGISVVAGEEYSAGVYVRSGLESFDGEISVRGYFVFPSGRPAEPAVFWHPVSPTEEDDYITIGRVGPTAGVWQPCGGTFQVPDGADALQLEIVARHIDGDVWDLDDVWCYSRNTTWENVTTEPITVEPGRSYEVSAWVRKDETAANGLLRVAWLCSGIGRPDLHLAHIDVAEGDADFEWQQVTFSFTIPDGYTYGGVTVACRNVDKGYWWVDQVSLRTTDTSSYEDLVADQVWAAAHGATQTAKLRDLTIPEGAQRLRLEWIAEAVGADQDAADGGGWRITGTSIFRTDLPVSTVAQVVADLLQDPEDDTVQLLEPGVIASAGNLRFDKRWRNLHNRDALRDLAQKGLAGDIYEWRTNPDRTLDFNLPETLCDDRTDVVLTPDMFEVLEPPDTTIDVTGLPTHVVAVGAELVDALGQKRLLEATATTGHEGVTLHGDELRRTLTVQASELDLPAAVQAFADYTASRQQSRSETRIRVSDLRHLGRMPREGDWIYIYDRESGLEDLDNPVRLDDGRTIHPMRLRIIERDWLAGLEGTHGVELLREDGTILPISEHVDYEGESTVSFLLGDRLPDFTSDPEGGPAAVQLLRLRHALTRAS